MTVKDAAPYIGASEYKLREMVREKLVPAYRIGSKIMFRKTTLDQWIEQQEAQNSAGK
ncbi:helix-turn-helix domain-containing protein [Paenibacillus sp. MCAF9]|uniref:helix-turn-helix domain-containing protein n=1 Tax=Paenibacillus sp. MCAF9 TaxID=3233046 RepID=UPI003F974A1F